MILSKEGRRPFWVPAPSPIDTAIWPCCACREVEGQTSVATVSDAAEAAGPEGLDTLTLYLAPHHHEPLVDDILAARPRRVIFNPGTESFVMQTALDKAGIPWLEACTLVLLSTGQY